MKSLSLDDYLKKQLESPKFQKEWAKSEPDYQISLELIRSRLEKGMSQRDLAKKAGTTQAVISKIERMLESPTVNLLQKLGSALGKKLEIKFAN